MFIKLLLLFTLVPIAEIYLLLELGRRVGTLPTVILVLGTGFFGVFLAKAQGLFVVKNILESLYNHELPGDELLSGMLVLVGSAFLLTPGLITDTVGFILLLPQGRGLVKRLIKKRLKRAIEDGTLRILRR